MSTYEIIWPVVGAVVALLVGVGVSVLSLARPAFRVARACFVLAAALLAGTAAAWTCSTDAPLARVTVVTVTIALAVAILLPLGFRWVHHLELEHRLIEMSGHVAKKKGPIVRLELSRDSHSPQHVCVVAVNDGDLAAINVTGECILRNGAIVIEFGPANVGVTSEPTLIPMRWFSGGRLQQTRDPYAFSDPPPECEFQTDTMKALLGAAIGEYTGGDGRPFVGPLRPEPLAHKFDITYTDPAQSERYYRTHILRYSRDTLRIDVDEVPGSADNSRNLPVTGTQR